MDSLQDLPKTPMEYRAIYASMNAGYRISTSGFVVSEETRLASSLVYLRKRGTFHGIMTPCLPTVLLTGCVQEEVEQDTHAMLMPQGQNMDTKTLLFSFRHAHVTVCFARTGISGMRC